MLYKYDINITYNFLRLTVFYVIRKVEVLHVLSDMMYD
jgi:hypothetical protein